MGNPTTTPQGVVPNPPSEAWVPIQTWMMKLVGDNPISWFLELNGQQYRFWKGDVTPVPPEPPPIIGQVTGWSIANTVAQAAGLIPPDPVARGALSAAQQRAQMLGDEYLAEIAPLTAPLPPVGS